MHSVLKVPGGPITNTLLTAHKNHVISVTIAICVTIIPLTLLFLELLLQKVERFVRLGHEQLLKQVLEQLVHVVALKVVLDLLLEFKFLALVHFDF